MEKSMRKYGPVLALTLSSVEVKDVHQNAKP
jgi:hypothetical protein